MCMSQKVKYTPKKLCWNSEKIPLPTSWWICGSIEPEALPKRQLRYQNLELEQGIHFTSPTARKGDGVLTSRKRWVPKGTSMVTLVGKKWRTVFSGR